MADLGSKPLSKAKGNRNSDVSRIFVGGFFRTKNRLNFPEKELRRHSANPTSYYKNVELEIFVIRFN